MILSLIKSRKADIPGWAYIVALVIGLFVIAFFIWVAVKSGGKTTDLLGQIRP